MRRLFHFFNHRLDPWLKALVFSTGGLGICVAGFIDSVAPLPPTLLDFSLILLAMHRPAHMPYYVLMTVIGSVLGGAFLYVLARKGEEALFHKRAGARGEKIRQWVSRNGFLAVLLGALLPPPMPFKLVILAAGVAEMPVRPFIFSLTLARVIRFSIEGVLAVEYGAWLLQFLKDHKVSSTLWTVAIAIAIYLAARIIMRPAKEAPAPPAM